MGIIEEYAGQIIYDEAQKKMEKYLAQRSLQKILLKTLKSAMVEVDNDVNKKILSISPEGIKPNLSVGKIKENLNEIFEILFHDSYNDRKVDFIVAAYKRNAMEDTLKLFHLEENIEAILEQVGNVGESIKKANVGIDVVKTSIKNVHENVSEIKNQVTKMPESILKAISERPTAKLSFIDQLDDSKAYFYLVIEVYASWCCNDDLIDDLKYILEEVIAGEYGNFEYVIKDNEGLVKLYIDFDEPILQCDLKEFLEGLNRQLCEESIKIVSILTHE